MFYGLSLWFRKHKWDSEIAAAGPGKDRQHHEELNVPCY